MDHRPLLRAPESVRASLARTADAILSVILAPRCAACSAPLDRPTRSAVCEDCWLAVEPLVPPLCRVCGGMLASWRAPDPPFDRCPACREQPRVIAASRSAGRYQGSLRDIVHAFKYDGRRSIASRLGTMMQDAGGDVLAGASCVVPVPLHPWRRLSRGFNQAADLASRLELPVVHALWRTRATVAQSGLTAARRKGNVRGAFTVSPLLLRRTRTTAIDDRTIVLVDDVRTTGATLDACARVLRQAGAGEVRALTAALADGRPPG